MNRTEPSNLKEHIWRTLVLSLPLVGSQLLQIAIGATDVVMVAKLGELPLAQVTLGGQLIFFAMMGVAGYSIAIAPIIGAAVAVDDEKTIRRSLRMGIWMAIIFTIIILPALHFSDRIFRFLGQPEEAIIGAKAYNDIALWSLIPIFFYNVFRNYLTVLEKMNAILLVAFIGFLVNILFNYLLIFGNFGFPALGLVGSAYATVITNFAIFLVVWIYASRQELTKRIKIFYNFTKADWPMFWRILKMGTLISLSLLSEVGLFQFATVMMGWISVTSVAAHGVVLQIAGAAFMIPLGISIALTVRVSKAHGRQDVEAFKMIVKSGAVITFAAMSLTSSVLLIFPNELISWILGNDSSHSPELIAMALSFLIIAAFFQMVDGAQVIAMGLLRGLQDVVIPSILAFICYWLIGVNLAYHLAFKYEMGGQGIWIGLAAGLAVASVTLWLRLKIAGKRLVLESSGE